MVSAIRPSGVPFVRVFKDSEFEFRSLSLKLLALTISLCMHIGSAFATVPYADGYHLAPVYGGSFDDVVFDSPESACAAAPPGPDSSFAYIDHSVVGWGWACVANKSVAEQAIIKVVYAGVYLRCPANSTLTLQGCECTIGFKEAGNACVPAGSPPDSGNTDATTAEPSGGASDSYAIAGMCTPNPIVPATGEKRRVETDWSDQGPAPLSFTRIYRSTWGESLQPAAGMGASWSHNFAVRLNVSPSATSGSLTAALVSPEGATRHFTQAAGATAWIAIDSADSLVAEAGGTWTYRRADDNATFTFSASGKPQTYVERTGLTTYYIYDNAGQLVSVRNPFGRTLTLSYGPAGQLISITTPDHRTLTYNYDGNGRLASVIYPDGKSRQFLYENAAYLQALTGILDEAGNRWGTFAYDTQGRAVSSELAGAADRYQVSYSSSGSAAITDPLGTSRSYSYATQAGKLSIIGGSLPSGTGESDAASRVQDANGLITSETDFNGVRTDYVWDVTRRLPTSITSAAGTPDARTVSTQWHPLFALPVLVTEPGRTTASAYDDRGNLLNRTVTDTATNKAQTWQWAYTAQSLVSTQTEPNGAVTRYEYDNLGNLTKSTNALGHVTQYSYDTASRVISQTAPNGVVTAYTYDARDRLLSRSVGGSGTITLTYKPIGKVETVGLPNGLVLTYTYDAAHRLVGWANNRGEQGTFTLDGMGNRVSEQIKDSSGAIAWMVARTVNNINRLSARTIGSNQTDLYGYDANGDLVAETNGLNQSTRYGLDALRRVSSITNPANATATLAWNALDAVTQATDFKGVATAYTRDAQGNATAETSADIGSRAIQHDSLGLPSTIVDALGQATRIERDLLGRPVSLTFADGKITTLRYDLTPQSTGYLSEIIDRSGTTQYTRDAFGRVILKRQSLANGLVQQVGYGYAANGLLASISYPSGSILSYQYDATGRLSQLNWNGNPLVTGLTWNPMGQPTAWNWAFTFPVTPAARAYDTAGRLTSTEFSSYVYDAAGRITSLRQNLFRPADADPSHTNVTGTTVTWNVRYDPIGRIIGFDTDGDTASFAYDPNGNRASSTRTFNGQTTSRSYEIDGAGNKLLGFKQTRANATTSVAYAYNANGDLLGDGLRTYSYDAEGRLSAVTTGLSDDSPTTRYAHNALGQRVFKTERLYPPSQGDERDPGLMQSLLNFFTSFWQPAVSDAEKLGWAFMYDEEGNLIAETGMGGAQSGGSAQYVHLPTAGGPMPIAMARNGTLYAIHSDHLNTPRRMTEQHGWPSWQWAYSPSGDESPTLASNRFANLDHEPYVGTTWQEATELNLRYPGQYYDWESGLHYNYFRSYSPTTGRYTQSDPIGLNGGWNRINYVDGNPLTGFDPLGLANGGWQPSRGMFANGREPQLTGANITVGGGGNFHTPLGIGMGIDGGLAADSKGNVCVYSNICYTAGPPGMSAALGAVGGVGSGALASGATTYQGACWTGGAGLTGSGAMMVGSDGSLAVGRGLAGVGGGASAAYQKCELRLLCAK